MEISQGIFAVDTSLFLEKEKVLIINDLHIGYEQVLHRKGILVPRFQLKEIIDKVKKIIKKTKPQKIILNGDIKHEFGTVLQREWKEVLEFFDVILGLVKEVIIIQGNHDPIIKPLANKRDVKVLTQLELGENIIVHGDEITKEVKESKAKRVIIGHEHPAITIRDGSKLEKFKCFLKGEKKIGKRKKEIIAVPSFNPLLEGTNVLEGHMLSPFLKGFEKFEVFVVGEDKIYPFGKVKDLL